MNDELEQIAFGDFADFYPGANRMCIIGGQQLW
jgi:hypothetical protein